MEDESGAVNPAEEAFADTGMSMDQGGIEYREYDERDHGSREDRSQEGSETSPTSWEDHLLPPEEKDPLPADAVAIAHELSREAKAAGYDNIESFVAARMQEQAWSQQEVQARQEWQEQQAAEQEAEQNWLQETHENLISAYQERIDSGELTEAQANAMYARDLEAAQYQRSHERANVDLASREIEQEIYQASAANPMLSVEDGLAGSLIKGLSLSGLLPTSTAITALNQFARAVEQKAIAEYVAREAEKGKNAAPVFYAGNGSSSTSPAEQPRTGDWADFLFRRSGIR